MTLDPIRLNLPSASSFSMTALCPGREALLRSIPPQPDTVDEDAKRGVALHLAWQLDDPSALDSEDTEIYERGNKIANEVLKQWIDDLKFKKDTIDTMEQHREQRLYLHDNAGDLVASGQADRHVFCGGHALVIDFKSLYCHNLVPSEINWQARLLAVLVGREYSATTVRFAFVKSMLNSTDIVDYSTIELAMAWASIQQALWEIRQPNAQRRPGDHCRHCLANAHCPESAAWSLLPSVQFKHDKDVTPTVASELVESLSLLNCAKIEKTKTSRRNIEDACNARLKLQTVEVLESLGLTFGKPKILRPITNVQSAFEFLLSVGVPADKLWGVTRMSNEELATVVQEALGLKSRKEANAWIKDKLGSCVTPKETERPLERLI